MCRFKSMLVVKEIGIIYSEDHDSHSRLVVENEIRETPDLSSRNYVSVEITSENDYFSLNREDWKISYDEESSIPTWYSKEEMEEKIIDTVISIVKKMIKTGRFLGDCDLREYAHALPSGLTSIGGNCYLNEYAHALSAGLTSIGGYCSLGEYAHALSKTVRVS